MVATVQTGGRIEVVRPDLAEGVMVEVSISPLTAAPAKWKLGDILEFAQGHRCFESAAEVDAHLRVLRDEWA